MLTPRQLGQVLGLPDNVQVVEIHRDPDRPREPVTVHIVFEGPELPAGWQMPVREPGVTSRVRVPMSTP